MDFLFYLLQTFPSLKLQLKGACFFQPPIEPIFLQNYFYDKYYGIQWQFQIKALKHVNTCVFLMLDFNVLATTHSGSWPKTTCRSWLSRSTDSRRSPSGPTSPTQTTWSKGTVGPPYTQTTVHQVHPTPRYKFFLVLFDN